MSDRPSTRCPRCGKGELVVISYTGEPAGTEARGQRPSSRQVDTYSCGHEILGPPLSRADGSLDVERRSSEETAEPRPGRR